MRSNLKSKLASPLFRIAGISALALVAGLTLYVLPGQAVPSPVDAAAPAPIRLAQVTPPASTLPGGASSLNETYRDWQVACAQDGAGKRCALSLTEARQNGQRVLTIQLNAPAGNTVAGALVLPFGLSLDAGVVLQVDDKPAGQPLRFRTCLRAGCVVALNFDAATIVALRGGGVLKVKTVADSGAEQPFSISLQGFATALDRVGALAQ
ncbi:MAG TPA: invasion associated locus B family protein [Devosiaceae bacterium]|jgi:invasion protein IalB